LTSQTQSAFSKSSNTTNIIMSDQKKTIISFDYEILDSKPRSLIQQKTEEIKKRLKRSAQDIWEIGQQLVEVRNQLNRGQFDTWIKAEFGWSRRTAYNFISVYEAFNQSENFEQINIASSALYLLAAPSTSDKVREKFIQKAEEGKLVTHKDVNQAVKSEKIQNTSKSEKFEPLIVSNSQKQEIISVIPKFTVEAIKASQTETLSTTLTSAFSKTIEIKDIEAGWYLLNKKHLLFCGDTALPEFTQRISAAALAIAITSNDWSHDWLIETAETVLIFPESKLKLKTFTKLIEMFSHPGEVIILPWLPHKEMLLIAHQLNRVVIAGDSSIERCRQISSYSQFSIESI
jgi:hypothetical protein